MSTISNWKNPVSGNYATASNRTNGVPNGTTIEAYLDALSGATTVFGKAQGNYTAALLSANHLAWSFVGDGHGGTDIKLVSTA